MKIQFLFVSFSFSKRKKNKNVTHGVQKKWQKADQRDIDKTEKARRTALSNDDYSYLYN